MGARSAVLRVCRNSREKSAEGASRWSRRGKTQDYVPQVTSDEMLFELLKTEADVEAAARELIDMAKADPRVAMTVLDFIFDDFDIQTN